MPAPTRRPGRRPHLMALLVGALDARHNHLDYFDTVGGQELLRLYREHRRPRPSGLDQPDGSGSDDSERAAGGTKDPREQDQTAQTGRVAAS